MTKVDVLYPIETNRDLSDWLRKLAKDIDTGIVDGFELSTLKTGLFIQGVVITPSPNLSIGINKSNKNKDK